MEENGEEVKRTLITSFDLKGFLAIVLDSGLFKTIWSDILNLGLTEPIINAGLDLIPFNIDKSIDSRTESMLYLV